MERSQIAKLPPLTNHYLSSRTPADSANHAVASILLMVVPSVTKTGLISSILMDLCVLMTLMEFPLPD
jgi:hypothetical protein